ncbi:alpha/beta fold hydrolase [Sphingomonas sp. MMS24-JH45]
MEPHSLLAGTSRTVIAVDLPGHGATPAEHNSGTFDGLVGSVERYILKKELTGIDVVGSSMGARIVLELARRGVVGNVVALDPGGFCVVGSAPSSRPRSASRAACCGGSDPPCRR